MKFFGTELNQVLSQAGAQLPRSVQRQMVGQSLGDFDVALCLHRVAEQRRPTDLQPAMTIAPDALDALIEFLLSTRNKPKPGWLTVSFDDGYLDAANYIDDRAQRFRDVQFSFFVCPEKSHRQVGFRWDLAEEQVKRGMSPPQAASDMDQTLDLAGENDRSDLAALAKQPEYTLASIDRILALRRHPNVTIGNHFNCHFRFTSLSLEDSDKEIAESLASFAKLFGETTEVAFPFGTPNHQFDARHVAQLRRRGSFLIWSTERRPFKSNERRPGAVLPRFPVDGQMPYRQLAAWIAVRALNFRLRGPTLLSL